MSAVVSRVSSARLLILTTQWQIQMAIYQLSTNTNVPEIPVRLMEFAHCLRRKGIAFQADANEHNRPHLGN
jgi:hypothetical protein